MTLIAGRVLNESLFLLYEDGFSVYSDEYLGELYESCEERPPDGSLCSLLKTHVACLEERGYKEFVSVCNESWGKALLVGLREAVLVECEDITERLDDSTVAELVDRFNPEDAEELLEELDEAKRVITCTISSAPKESFEELEGLLQRHEST